MVKMTKIRVEIDIDVPDVYEGEEALYRAMGNLHYKLILLHRTKEGIVLRIVTKQYDRGFYDRRRQYLIRKDDGV